MSPPTPKQSHIKLTAARKIKEQLENLECPFTENADESWLLELILTPGEPRIRILQWLLSRFHKKIYDTLDPIISSGRTESRLKALLFISASLGVCRRDDIDLIEGKTGGKKQMKFINKLLDLVTISDASEDPRWRLSPSKYAISDSTDIVSQCERDAELIDSMVRLQPIDSLYPANLSLLPPDIYRSLELNATTDSKNECNVEDLTQRLNLIQQDLTNQQEALQELQSEFNYMEDDPKSRANYMKRFKLLLSELQQTIVSYNYCYEHNIQQWCNRKQPELSPLGEKFSAINRLLGTFTTMLGAMKIIKAAFHKIEALPQETASKRSELGQQEETLYKSIYELEQSLRLVNMK